MRLYPNSLTSHALVALTAGLWLQSCANTSKKTKKSEENGYSVPAIAKASKDFGVPERHLLTAAFVQSQVAGNVSETKELALSTRREPIFGMPLATLPTDSKDTLEERSLSLAKITADLAAKRQPKNDFDWLLCIAQTIVGEEEKDPNIRDHQIRILLLQMIEAHNSGYAVFFADGTRSAVQPSAGASKIDLSALDVGRGRYVTSFGLNSNPESDFSLEGDEGLVAEDRPPGAKFTLQLRACPANALLCFDDLRNSREAGVHFVTYKIGPAQWEMVQLQPIAKDLRWYGQTQAATIVVAIAGVSNATTAQKRVNFLDWSDYVALRKNLNDVLAKGLKVAAINIKDKLNSGTPFFTTAFLTETLRPVLNAGAEGLAPTPGKKQSFVLPAVWDSALFQEVMNSNQELRSFSQIQVERPAVGGEVANNTANISFLPDPEAAEVSVFQDKPIAAAGEPWDLILKKDVLPGDNRVSFDQQFLKKGSNNSAERALKFVTRKSNGQIISSKIVRFQVTGLKLK